MGGAGRRAIEIPIPISLGVGEGGVLYIMESCLRYTTNSVLCTLLTLVSRGLSTEAVGLS